MNPWFTTLPWVLYLNFKTKACFHTARFEKATRYYVIRLEQDLLGDWTLCISNGRIKSRPGQSRIIAFECFSDACEHFCLMAKERNQRGYHPVSYDTEDLLYQTMVLWACITEKPVTAQKRKTTTHKKRVRSPSRPTPEVQYPFHDIHQMPLIF
ncbi:WGR domain-containing protein [Legionella sp. PATHC038]|uniref:WGR domain-containing protein n=1 Tax=Legionella sheltonii TaxID=2992041 RepID=UPI002244A2F5|nr:WGR domain-containing protein [Legionella sp. PATHC038]MCW8399517.1 WGR domain-containing protein [Legionella sp. PATHC038]